MFSRKHLFLQRLTLTICVLTLDSTAGQVLKGKGLSAADAVLSIRAKQQYGSTSLSKTSLITFFWYTERLRLLTMIREDGSTMLISTTKREGNLSRPNSRGNAVVSEAEATFAYSLARR